MFKMLPVPTVYNVKLAEKKTGPVCVLGPNITKDNSTVKI